MNRRRFLQGSASGAMLNSSASAAASDRIRVGVIGSGGQGRNNLGDFQKNRDCEIVAVCDVFQPNLKRGIDMTDGRARAFTDYRRLLEDKDIDAVVVATPEHWHALMMVDACNAAKDVYVEKPISLCVREGRLMVEAARRNNRVVQVGIQQRSGSHFQRAVKQVQDGRIGKVLYAQCWNHSWEPAGGGARSTDTAAPADLDWDRWLGPAPSIPYSTARRRFGSYWSTGGGQMTNWAVHLIDIVHWATGEDAPKSVSAMGGVLYLVNDERETPDTLQVIFQYPGYQMYYSTLRHNSYGHDGHPGNKPFGSYGIRFHGTEGTLFVDRAGYEITPQMRSRSDPGAMGSRDAYDDLTGVGIYFTTEGKGERGTTSIQHFPHVRNFLDCVKSRQKPLGDIEIGHRSTAACHLANISYRTGERVEWDGTAERITNSARANELLTVKYRDPWRLPGL
ncbi:MAG: Gfo/Idh/MocA family protein [Bryobacteraceae bacterium]